MATPNQIEVKNCPCCGKPINRIVISTLDLLAAIGITQEDLLSIATIKFKANKGIRNLPAYIKVWCPCGNAEFLYRLKTKQVLRIRRFPYVPNV